MPDKITITILGPVQSDNEFVTNLLIGDKRDSLPLPMGEYQLATLKTNKRDIDLHIWTLAEANKSKMAMNKYCQESDILIFVYNPEFDDKFKRLIEDCKHKLKSDKKPTATIVRDTTNSSLEEYSKKFGNILKFATSLQIFKSSENNNKELITALTTYVITQKFPETVSNNDFVITPFIKPLLTADKTKINFPYDKIPPIQLQNLTNDQAYFFLQNLQEEIFNNKWHIGLFGGEFVYLKDNEKPGIIVPKTIKAILDEIDDAAQSKQTNYDATIKIMQLISVSIDRTGTFFNRRHPETQNFYANRIPELLQNALQPESHLQNNIDTTPYKSHKIK